MIIGKQIFQFPEVDSTNDEAKQLIKAGHGEGTVVVASAQRQGRGKPGHSWHSPSQVGVYLSAVVVPFRNPQQLTSITQIGARAVVASIELTSGLVAAIKQPNDVLLNGRKIAGILVERLASGQIIIGIGVNINNDTESFLPNLANSATSLKIETAKEYPLAEFISILIKELDREYLEYLKEVC